MRPSHSEMDLLDLPSVQSYFKKNPVDMVIHTAGLVGGIYANMNNNIRFLTEKLDNGAECYFICKGAWCKRAC